MLAEKSDPCPEVCWEIKDITSFYERVPGLSSLPSMQRLGQIEEGEAAVIGPELLPL